MSFVLALTNRLGDRPQISKSPCPSPNGINAGLGHVLDDLIEIISKCQALKAARRMSCCPVSMEVIITNVLKTNVSKPMTNRSEHPLRDEDIEEIISTSMTQ